MLTQINANVEQFSVLLLAQCTFDLLLGLSLLFALLVGFAHLFKEFSELEGNIYAVKTIFCLLRSDNFVSISITNLIVDKLRVAKTTQRNSGGKIVQKLDSVGFCCA
jgi:hypothetical protein